MELYDNYYGNLRAYKAYHQDLCKTIQKQMDRWDKKNRNSDKLEWDLVRYIRLLPDLYQVAFELLQDETLPFHKKGALYVGLMYVISPVDMISDHITVFGWVDDLIVMALALRTYISQEDPSIRECIKSNWQHTKDLKAILHTIISIFDDVAETFPPSMVNIIRDMFCTKVPSAL